MDDERITRITLRIPRELDERLDAEALRTSKSKNAEIVGRLEESFVERGSADLDAFEAKLDKYLGEFESQHEQRARLDKAVIGILSLAVMSLDRAHTDNMINTAIKLLGGEEVRPNKPRD